MTRTMKEDKRQSGDKYRRGRNASGNSHKGHRRKSRRASRYTPVPAVSLPPISAARHRKPVRHIFVVNLSHVTKN